MPIKQRLINCDFLNFGGFLDNISNKAKLLYFMFIVNADDLGFVGNGVNIANALDQCEEKFDNTLFTFKYIDAIEELTSKGFLYVFSDKYNNKTFLIRAWFKHNKEKNFLSTNFTSYYSMVGVKDGEYYMKNIEKDKEETPYKVKQNKVKESKVNDKEIESININNKEKEPQDWEKDWEKFQKEIAETTPKGE